jgi:alkylhydroperoxidase family enzyme
MAVVNPIPKDRASGDVKPIYEDLTKRFGRVPNIFGVMAHRPDVLKSFLPLYGAIITQGTVEPKLKELAYLKVSMVNGCEY